MAIREFNGAYRFLSNFWPCKITMWGLEFQSVEAAYQAAKCDNDEDRKQFTSYNASKAKRVGKTISMREDWDEVKIDFMRVFLTQKFEDPILRKRLVETAPQELIEGNTWGDTFWGVCRGLGSNNLGKLLMEVRTNIIAYDMEEEMPAKRKFTVWTGIGSRETPKEVMHTMTTFAGYMAGFGLKMRSGGADGADQACEDGYTQKNAHNLMEIILPWNGFRTQKGTKYVNPNKGYYLLPVEIREEAEMLASKYHPVWDNLTDGAKKLHTRNVPQILGLDLKSPTDFVVCYTKDGGATGGTGQAIRVAQDHDIEIINLFYGYDRLIEMFKKIKGSK